MAITNDQAPAFRCDSPPPDSLPTPAIGACPELSRCLSTASSWSHGSSSDAPPRESLGSDHLSSRHSSATYTSRVSDVSAASRQSTSSVDGKARHRRGYMRPHGTDFAASAKSRESVMSLGSIAHLQYYFARTGLLDGKGGQLARRKRRATLDRISLGMVSHGSDGDSPYGSAENSPEYDTEGLTSTGIVDSPVEELGSYYDDEYPESEPDMLPPTVSTYNYREKPIPKPPSMSELKSDLESALAVATKALQEVQARKAGTYQEPAEASKYPNMPETNSQEWYELQGMHILDVVTLAIRAAKVYYTAHELPDRLDSIKSEKQVRAELLGVMEVLKQMATRGFKDGIKDEEINVMDDWVESIFSMLEREQEIEETEQAEREGWTWLKGDWTGREYERERAFLMDMDNTVEPLPEWTPVAEAAEAPTPFLQAMQNGLRLVNLHNAAVKKSRRRFGAIPAFHIDTQKPYRCADNLRYWAKAAELRFEVMLTIDALGVVYNNGPEVWEDFEQAILKWCRHVREEIAGDLENQ